MDAEHHFRLMSKRCRPNSNLDIASRHVDDAVSKGAKDLTEGKPQPM
jgi:hypothetical protein